MTDDTKLFELVGGLLQQIPPDLAEAARKSRHFGRTHTVIDILWTPEEEAAATADAAAREAEAAAQEKASLDAAKIAQAAAEEGAAARAAAIAKLERLGLTVEDINAVLG